MSNEAHDYSDITAVILAGGKGTRLKSAVSDRPKVLASVLNRPFITYLLDQIKAVGIKKVVLSTGYMSEVVYGELGESYDSLSLSYCVEDTPLGTGGGLRNALDLLDSEVVLVLNGDSYAALDLSAFLNWFSLGDKVLAIALAKVGDVSRYGSVTLGEDGVISSFIEKGGGAEGTGGAGTGGPGLINAGVYLIRRSLIAGIKVGVPYSLEHELFTTLTGTDSKLWGFPFEGAFIDIGTPESYACAESFFDDNKQNSI